MSDGRSAILRLCAYLVRQSACVDEDAPVVLDVVPETLRMMALAAKDERDELCAAARAAKFNDP